MKRLAIYYAPPKNDLLSREAARWLGRDAYTGAPLEPAYNGFSRDAWESIVADPRLYGFHATLKPPFRMAEGALEEDLREAIRRFAAARQPFEAKLRMGALSHFLALTLDGPSPEFEALAADCVRTFDRFRAPASPEELARRRRGRTHPAQLAYIDRWGYPYVFEEWRFHMTLTGSLPPDTLEAARVHLTRVFEPLIAAPRRIDAICLFEQASEGAPFVVAERFHFA